MPIDEDDFGGAAHQDPIPAFAAEIIGAAPLKRTGPVDLQETLEDRKDNRLREIENSIYERGLMVIDGVSRFGQVDPQNPDEVPDEILDDFRGDIRAQQHAHRLAKYALINAKEAPVGIAVMSRVVVGIAKARSMEKAAPRSLNVAFINVSSPIDIPVQEIDE